MRVFGGEVVTMMSAFAPQSKCMLAGMYSFIYTYGDRGGV